MSFRRLFVFFLPVALAGVATAQIATSNEDGATGAYSDEINSSFTSEARFGPRTALDDLRADVDREREAQEKLRQRAAKAASQVEDDADETDDDLLTIQPYVPEEASEPETEE